TGRGPNRSTRYPSTGTSHVSVSTKMVNATWIAARPQWYLASIGLTNSVHPYCRFAIIVMQTMPKISCHQRPARTPFASVAMFTPPLCRFAPAGRGLCGRSLPGQALQPAILLRGVGRHLGRTLACGKPFTERDHQHEAERGGDQLQAVAGDVRLVLSILDAKARQPPGERAVGDEHLARHPADESGAQGNDHREALHQLDEERRAEDDERNRDGEAEDQQHIAAPGGGSDRDDVVEAHDEVGDQYRLDGGQ